MIDYAIGLPASIGFALCGCLIVYLSSENQRMRSTALGRNSRIGGVIALIASLELALLSLAPAAAVAVWGVSLMLGFMIWPLWAALKNSRS